MTDAAHAEAQAAAQALSLARDALAARPAGLFADFDGTLSPIVRDPMAARLAPGAGAALTALAADVAVVCIVTGRAAADVRRMTGLDDVWVAGNHGIEWLAPGESDVLLPPELVGVPAELDRLLAAVPPLPGLWLEDKDLSATVHYRRSPHPAEARRRILDALGSAISGEGIELREGRLAVELRPTGIGDKGTAVRRLAERFELRGMIVLGDDLTDVDMFRAAHQLHEEQDAVVAVIGVGGPDGEVSPRVAAAADALVPSPDAVVRLLEALGQS